MSHRDRIYRTHVLVLSRRDYNDADRVLRVFTPSLGKLELIAKGIRKTTSRKAGHLELFTHASLLIAQARTWDIVTEAVTVENFRYLRESLEAIGRANYIGELVDSFSEADNENLPLWDLLLFALRELDEQSHPPVLDTTPLLLRWFELHLLTITGFQPQFFHCLVCQEPLTPTTNFLSLSEGGIYCPNCGKGQHDVEPIEPDVLKVLRFLQSRDWSEVRALVVRPLIMLRVENILYRYLLTILERQPKSVEFLRKLQSMMKQTIQ